jgi:hypothetical protein
MKMSMVAYIHNKNVYVTLYTKQENIYGRLYITSNVYGKIHIT